MHEKKELLPVASGRTHRLLSRSNRQRSLNVVLVDVQPSIIINSYEYEQY